jgi:hypothetical protein
VKASASRKSPIFLTTRVAIPKRHESKEYT